VADKNIFAKKSAKKLAFLTQNKANLIITLVFEKNANFFAENWRYAENYDRNINPWLGVQSKF
jgi:hypothetical protein